MDGIQVPFVSLQVVAFMVALHRAKALFFRNPKQLIVREQRRFPWADISEDHTADLFTGIGRMEDEISL
jgi:hypothetical protein